MKKDNKITIAISNEGLKPNKLLLRGWDQDGNYQEEEVEIPTDGRVVTTKTVWSKIKNPFDDLVPQLLSTPPTERE